MLIAIVEMHSYMLVLWAELGENRKLLEVLDFLLSNNGIYIFPCSNSTNHKSYLLPFNEDLLKDPKTAQWKKDFVLKIKAVEKIAMLFENTSKILVWKEIEKTVLELLEVLGDSLNFRINRDIGDTILHKAIQMQNMPFILRLLAKGANFNITNKAGKSPSDLMVSNTNPKIKLLGLLMKIQKISETASCETDDL